ncbi:hypothetical protein O181_107115 [Austropuccinia psidii MF-1]|uniref:Uncharacterized protein n=1 Tax=Austropuccinia psidii MF-1 TaxID=1389203 RepID=A0A9Q3JTT1_9BASI|nr:hypothetical protein [Austropuccinia psidii MF-1]
MFNNVTCNHVKPSSHISQLHPFDAPCWRALPNYSTDVGVIQVNESGSYWDDLLFGSYTNSGVTAVPLTGQTLTGRAFSLRVLIGGQPHAFIHTPQRVRDCRCSPAHAWKTEANQCGFASARPMFVWGSATAGHFVHIITRPAQVVVPGLQPKNPLGGWPLLPEFRSRGRQRP